MKGFGRQSTGDSLEGSKHAGRVFGGYSVGSEEDFGGSSQRETLDDDEDISISTSRTSLTDADDDNLRTEATPKSGNLAARGRTQHRTSGHQSAGIELGLMTNKTKKDGFKLMSQDTFDAQSQSMRPTSLRTTTTTTTNTGAGGDGMDISAPTLLARGEEQKEG